MSEITISVAMCTYNGSGFLDEQLRSLSAQTRLPDELVICDDHSCDETITILKEFIAIAPFPVRLFENPTNIGPTKNFEQAFAKCSCDIIAPCDQDDSWYPDKLYLTATAFAQNPSAGLVFGDADITDGKLVSKGIRLWNSVDFNAGMRRQVDRGRAFEALLKFNFITGATMAFRASFRSLIIPIPECWIHDGWVAIIIAAISEVIRLDRVLIKYRQHPKQVLGAPRQGTGINLAVARAAITSNEFLRKRTQYALVYERLQSQEARAVPSLIKGFLLAKGRHLECRERLPKYRLFRFPVVIREFLLNRYRQFGHGWKSAARDLVTDRHD